MWLLSTARAELTFFASPEAVPGGYAILSHVWLKDTEEDTFQQVQLYAKECRDNARFNQAVDTMGDLPRNMEELHAVIVKIAAQLVSCQQTDLRTATNGAAGHMQNAITPASVPSAGSRRASTNPRDLVSPKIRDFLILAEKHGYEWAWADTCCIDKTSSSELTEAINSMFRYYALSEVCYVHLSDVVPECDPSERRSDFWLSRWHTRGWTLQELLASTTIIFLSRDWTILGDKYSLAPTLEEITGVPTQVLRFEMDIAHVSIAQRMSWAARRRTTREEDEAYCLFGLFGISIPALYGEGRNAFYRLQEEICRTSIDTSLFTWGHPENVRSLNDLTWNLKRLNFDTHAFAPSPVSFIGCTDVVFSGHDHKNDDPDFDHGCTVSPKGARFSLFTLTPQGIQAHLPVIHLDDVHVVAKSFCTQEKRPLWLLLRREDPRIAWTEWPGANYVGPLSVHDSIADSDTLEWKWEDVCIRPRPSFLANPRANLASVNANTSIPYRIKPSTLSLAQSNGLRFINAENTSKTGVPRVVLEFLADRTCYVYIVLGRCTRSRASSVSTAGSSGLSPILLVDEAQRGIHFTQVYFRRCGDPNDRSALARHACADDHVWNWPGQTRTFEHSTRDAFSWARYKLSITISFTVTPLSSRGETLEFQIGYVREMIKPSARFSGL